MKRLRNLHRREERRPGALLTSVIVHAVIFAIVFVAARRVAQVVVDEPRVMTFRLPPPPPPPPPPAGGRKRQVKQVEKKPEIRREIEVPQEIPDPVPEPEPLEEPEPEEPMDEGVEGGVEGGVVGGVVGGELGGVEGGTLGGVVGNPLPEEPWDPSMAREISVGVTPPKLLKRVPPEYPLAAQRRRVEGEVVLRCVIKESGDVEVAEVMEGPDALEDAAIRAVERWKYEPAVYRERPQAVYLMVRLNFKLPR